MARDSDPVSELTHLSKGHTALMDTLSAAINYDMLAEIADADYGMNRDTHLEELTKIRNREPPSGRMEWEPKEVLSLFRWSEFGDNRTGQKKRGEADFHTMRAFCCTALLEAFPRPENYEYFDGENQTLIQLLDSLDRLKGLGTDHEGDAIPFLSWLLITMPPEDEERAFFYLGLVWLLLRQDNVLDNKPLILKLTSHLVAEEQRVRASWGHGVGDTPETWLLGTTFHGIRHDKWRRIGEHLSQWSPPNYDPELANAISDIGKKLS